MQLEQGGVKVETFYTVGFLTRLVSLKDSKLSFHFWLKRKLNGYLKDAALLKKLKRFDIIIISECTPNAFLRSLYNIEKFRRIIQKPVGLYEVYFLGNAPTQINFLKENNNSSSERYDFHLSVSDVTEIKQQPTDNWYPIGIKAESWNLKPMPKNELVAIIDFPHEGNEEFRKAQISSLQKAGIKYISLEKPYTIEEIRRIYQEGAIYFMQSYEAFGLPLLESFCCGCQVFTPESWWPMSWRLNENPAVHGEGVLPDCFSIYKSEEELVKELLSFKEKYDLTESPKKVFKNFLAHYPQFYFGNENELQRFLRNLKIRASRAC
ncbi:MAG: hypothetical protein ACTHOB_05940 [Ginsengibacter sp.]